MGAGMVRLTRTRTLAEATLLRDTLAAAGIHAELTGQQRGSVLGEIPVPDAMVEVLVAASDEDRARGLVEELERGAGGPAWTCPSCGEENPPEFELCWKCGQER